MSASGDDSTVTVDAEVTDVEEDSARVTRSASVAQVVQEPRDVLSETEFENDFELYNRLLEIDPELAGSIRAQAQLASGFRVIHPAVEGKDEEPTSREETALRECQRLVEKLSLKLEQPSIFARLVAMGNDINKIVYSQDAGVEKLQSLPLETVTIVDDETQTNIRNALSAAKDAAADSDEVELDLDIYRQNLVDATVQSGDWYVLNEGHPEQKMIPSFKILHFNTERRTHWWEDEFDRQTYGVWGKPRIEPTKFSLQAKHNTLTNKVALDDSLIAREIYKIDIDTLFGHIKNDGDRQDKADEYATELKNQLEGLGPGEQPILPKEVEVEVKGPQGQAREHADFLNMMNDSIMHALTFHVGSVGRDAGGMMQGNRPSKDMSHNNVTHLRNQMAHKLRELFRMHLKLLHADQTGWVDKNGETGQEPDISKWKLNSDIVLPKVMFDEMEAGDMERKVNVATKAYNSKLLTRNEAREVIGFDPLSKEDAREKIFEDQRLNQEVNQEFMDHEQQKPDDDSSGSGSDSNSDDSSDSSSDEAEVARLESEQIDENAFSAVMVEPMKAAEHKLRDMPPEQEDDDDE